MGAGVLAETAVAAVIRVNIGTLVRKADGVEAAGALAGASHAGLAGVADEIAGLEAAVTGNVADGQNGPCGLFAGKGALRVFLQRHRFVPFLFESEAERTDDAFADNGAILVDTAAGGVAGARTHTEGNLVHAFFQTAFPEGRGDMFKHSQAQCAGIVGRLYGHIRLLKTGFMSRRQLFGLSPKGRQNLSIMFRRFFHAPGGVRARYQQ